MAISDKPDTMAERNRLRAIPRQSSRQTVRPMNKNTDKARHCTKVRRGNYRFHTR